MLADSKFSHCFGAQSCIPNWPTDVHILRPGTFFKKGKSHGSMQRGRPGSAMVLLCPIGEQFLLSSFCEFVHDCYYFATVARFVQQAFLTRNEGTTDESKNVSDALSRSNSICSEKILFLTHHNVS